MCTEGSFSHLDIGFSLRVVHGHFTDVGLGSNTLGEKLLEEDVSLSSLIDEHLIIIRVILLSLWLLLLLWLLLWLLLSKFKKTDVNKSTFSKV